MSTEKGVGERSSSQGTNTPSLGTSLAELALQQTGAATTQSVPSSPPKLKEEEERSREPATRAAEEGSKRQARHGSAEPMDSRPAPGDSPRQVIAVSASKGPAAFFNLARKFLATDEMCDLSALEGAIVSAVDAAHLLERSQLATIVRVHTSYVTVEPKRRKQATQPPDHEEESAQQTSASEPASASATPESTSPPDSKTRTETAQQQEPAAQPASQPTRQSGSRSHSGRELRRARIVITVKRTDSYKRWLDDNPLQAIIAGDTDEAEIEQPPEDSKQLA